MRESNFFFPEWTNRAVPLLGAALAVLPLYVLMLLYYGGSPRTTDVGYSPQQPLPFSHALHAGQMGMDCRYCHTTVESAAFAAVPPTAVCMNCHTAIAPESDKLKPVRQSAETGDSIDWIRVHDLPDFVYFDHSAHVTRGVSCVSCHGRIDNMEQVYQAKTLSMGWCLECHRDPAPNIRPPEFVTDLDWTADEDPRQLGERLMQEMGLRSFMQEKGGRSLTPNKGLRPSTDCSTCHR